MSYKRVLVWAIALSLAFLPNDVLGFTERIHGLITVSVLEDEVVVVGGEALQFSDRALEEIEAANLAMDSVLSSALFRPERHFTDDDLRAASQRLIRLRQSIVNELEGPFPNGFAAREDFGHALHAIQDYYAHSNWVELGNANINNSLGRSTIANPPGSLEPCPDDPNMLAAGGGGGLTSGWVEFKFILEPPFGSICDDTLPEGRCFHGDYTLDCVGINKDLDAVDAAHHTANPSPFHNQARSLAESATRDFFQQIIDEIGANEVAVQAFLGATGMVGFVIDDTGSMGDEIDGVKQVVEGIVAFIDSDPSLRPPAWILERFGDPDVGPPFLTAEAGELLAAVNALGAVGGGDCPELAFTALSEAIDTAYPSSSLFLFTDADPKDGSIVNAVISAAVDKRTAIFPVLTGDCGFSETPQGQDVISSRGLPDESFRRLAEETGGQVIAVQSSEVASLFSLFEPELMGNPVIIRSESGLLPAVADLSFPIPVDSTMTSLGVTVSLETVVEIELIRPSGIPVTATDPGVSFTTLSSGQVINVADPEAGVWQLEITGVGEYSIEARGTSNLELLRFDFVEENIDVHGGVSPLQGQPLAGTTPLVRAILNGEFSDVGFEFTDTSGATLSTLTLSQEYPLEPEDHFIGTVDLPGMPFRVVASGLDASGEQFRRQYPTLYRAQTVAVEVVEGPFSIVAGGSDTIRFQVENLGAQGVFDIEVADPSAVVTFVSTEQLTLETGAADFVEVDVTVPEEAFPDGTPVSVTFSASRADEPTVFNAATHTFATEGGGPQPPVVEVPTLGAVGLVGLILMLAALGGFSLRRQRQT